MAGEARRTPLYEEHLRLGARMVEFAGFLLPLQFRGILAEHRAVRQAAGVFDVSHMGKLRVQGPEAAALLSWLCPADVSRLEEGQARYTFFCDEDGGVIDDLVATRLGPEDFLLVVNAAATEEDRAWLAEHGAGRQVTVTDLTAQWALVAVQGPRAVQVGERVLSTSLQSLPRFHARWVPFSGGSVLVSRTGYTGEDGIEVLVQAADAPALWRQLLAAGEGEGLIPAGLGARDTLRVEAGLPLRGQELDRGHTPLEANLGRLVPLTRPFLGREGMLRREAAPSVQRLVGLRLAERAVPRTGQVLVHAGQEVGRVTSGAWAPSLGVSVAMGYVPARLAEPGTRFEVDIRGRRVPAEAVPLPFYRRPRA